MIRRPRLPGIGSHQSARRATDEWLTPPHILAALGSFDLDPCAATDRPWPTAETHIAIEHDGLGAPWHGRVWLNPPYSEIAPWMARMAAHGEGTALVFARCETAWWFASIWPAASAILFLQGRLTFCRPDGTPAPANSGGPSALVAYGDQDAEVLRTCGLAGTWVQLAPAELMAGR
ncbi:MAG: DNA N-6-adenine-methyltransferase [Acidimicrobiales bacterium]